MSTISVSNVTTSKISSTGSDSLSISTGNTSGPTITLSTNALAFAGPSPTSPTQFINGYATTATAAGTTVLTVTSAQIQYFTGTSTQTVTLPVVSTLVLGQSFEIVNLSTGSLTVNSSGANLVATVLAGHTVRVQVILTSGTSAASWNVIAAVPNPLTLSGSSVGYTPIQLISTEAAAAAGPIFELYRNSASPAANDILGQVLFTGEDSADNTQEYASIEAVIADATSASEDSVLDFYVQVEGVRTLSMSLTGANVPFGVVRVQVFTASGTYTPHASMKYCEIEAVGGGGGGGGALGTVGNYFAGAGGGSGAYSRLIASAADIGASMAVTIGSGGSAGAATPTNGGAGGDTSLGSLVVAKGGGGGSAGSGSIGPLAGGLGGAAASGTGTIRVNGGTGEPGAYIQSNVAAAAGMGAYSLLGAGGANQISLSGATAGGGADGYGGGGAGASAGNTASGAAGGAGAAGIVIITEFCSA